jgi:hypothetical protein
MRSGKVLFPLIAVLLFLGTRPNQYRCYGAGTTDSRWSNWFSSGRKLVALLERTETGGFAEADRMTPAPSHVGYWFFYIISRLTL